MCCWTRHFVAHYPVHITSKSPFLEKIEQKIYYFLDFTSYAKPLACINHPVHVHTLQNRKLTKFEMWDVLLSLLITSNDTHPKSVKWKCYYPTVISDGITKIRPFYFLSVFFEVCMLKNNGSNYVIIVVWVSEHNADVTKKWMRCVGFMADGIWKRE